jgi:muconolactone delta-isomerase
MKYVLIAMSDDDAEDFLTCTRWAERERARGGPLNSGPKLTSVWSRSHPYSVAGVFDLDTTGDTADIRACCTATGRPLT